MADGLGPYERTPEVDARLQNDFTYHKPVGDQAERYEAIRFAGYLLALHLTERAPPSRELSLALTKVDEAVFWANAAIARNEKEEGG